jgi:hypothetical protein
MENGNSIARRSHNATPPPSDLTMLENQIRAGVVGNGDGGGGGAGAVRAVALAPISRVRVLRFGKDCSLPDVGAAAGPTAGGAGWGEVERKRRKVPTRRRKTDRVGGKRHEEDEGRQGHAFAISLQKTTYGPYSRRWVMFQSHKIQRQNR